MDCFLVKKKIGAKHLERGHVDKNKATQMCLACLQWRPWPNWKMLALVFRALKTGVCVTVVPTSKYMDCQMASSPGARLIAVSMVALSCCF